MIVQFLVVALYDQACIGESGGVLPRASGVFAVGVNEDEQPV